MRACSLAVVALIASAAAMAEAAPPMVVAEPDPDAEVVAAPAPPPPLHSFPREDGVDEAVAAVIATTVAILGADLAFTIYSGVSAGNGETPPHGYLIAETAVAAPQALLLHGATAFIYDEPNGGDALAVATLLLPLSAWTSGLTTHGIWSAAASDSGVLTDPRELLGASMLVGANAALTTALLRRTFAGELHGTPVAIAAMVGSAPSIAVSAYEIAASDVDEPGWIALSAWSGALFLHGGISLAVSLADDDEGCPDTCGSALTLAPTTIGGGPGLTLSGAM